MAATEYLTIARRRWKLIVLLVAVALAAVYWTSPCDVEGDYEATHILLVEGDEGRSGSSAANPQVVALRTTVGEVPARVADAIGFDGEPEELAAKVSAEADRALGTVTITATDDDPERAVEIANAFAAEVTRFITEEEQARHEQAASELAQRELEVRAQIAALDAQIAANPPNLATLVSERDGLLRRLSDIEDAQSTAPELPQFATLQAATVGIEQEALPGTRSRAQRMLLAGIVALVLGFGLAVALDRSDTRLRSRQAAEAHFGLPVLAEIPWFSLPSRHRKLVVSDDPDSVRAESYRTLRAAVMLYRRRDDADRRPAGGGEGPQGNGHPVAPDRSVLMVTSAGAGEGKTTTSANLAAAYAESGRSVLVLSCDLWRSGIARHFGVKLGRGVSDFLAADDDTPLDDYIRDTSIDGVRMVTAGLAIRRPGGRLFAEQRLIDQARARADVVILDTAPILSAALTRELATMVDAVVVVCRVGRTTAGDAERCGELLDQLAAPSLGVVLVGVPAPAFSGYFSYVSPRRGHKERARAVAEEAAASSSEPVGTDTTIG